MPSDSRIQRGRVDVPSGCHNDVCNLITGSSRRTISCQATNAVHVTIALAQGHMHHPHSGMLAGGATVLTQHGCAGAYLPFVPREHRHRDSGVRVPHDHGLVPRTCIASHVTDSMKLLEGHLTDQSTILDRGLHGPFCIMHQRETACDSART